jgi:hypothetical protein
MSSVVEPILPLREPVIHQASVKAEIGSSVEATATVVRAAPHQEMLSWIEVLEALMAKLPKQRRGIGHNLQPVTKEEASEITQAAAVLKVQLVAPTAPDAAKAAGSTLQKIAGRLGTYLDTFLLEASKSGGKEFGKQLARAPYSWALWYALTHIVQSVAAWLP